MPAISAPKRCPFCGQPIINAEAIAHLNREQADFERKITGQAKRQFEARWNREVIVIRKAEQAKAAGEIRQLREELRKVQALVERRAEKIARAKIAKARENFEAGIREKIERDHYRREKTLRGIVDRLKEENRGLQNRLDHVSVSDQGEFNEQDLQRVLMHAFSEDTIQHAGRGKAGADIIQRVRYRAGSSYVIAGTIVYECKDTLSWQNEFFEQAKHARETHRTPHVVLVSRAFPRNQKDLFWKNDIPIVHPSKAVHLAHVIRRMVIEVHRASLSDQDRARKTAELYRYLSSEDFRRTISDMSETSENLQKYLRDERKLHARIWAKRERGYTILAQRVTTIDEAVREIIESPSIRRAENVALARAAASPQ